MNFEVWKKDKEGKPYKLNVETSDADIEKYKQSVLSTLNEQLEETITFNKKNQTFLADGKNTFVSLPSDKVIAYLLHYDKMDPSNGMINQLNASLVEQIKAMKDRWHRS